MENLLTVHGPGREVLFSGNQAIARGCVEAGVTLAIGYPGTPTTPVIEMLSSCGAELTARWAVNEKVALDFAIGHSWAGLRSLVTLKMSGLNVAADSLLSLSASGTVGGLVLYVGDDPNVYYGMVEQDSRHYARLGVLPVLCPSSPSETLEMTRFAFDLSEKAGSPVLLLSTTVLANTHARVRLGDVKRLRQRGSFSFDVDRWTKAGSARCVSQHQRALARLETAREETLPLNPLVLSGSRLGVAASGAAWAYLAEELDRHGLDVCRLKVGTPHPFPRGQAARLLAAVDRLLVLEELDPIVEDEIRAEATRCGKVPLILGKESGHVPLTGDLNPELVRAALSALLSRELPPPPALAVEEAEIQRGKIPRLLTFCPGCPHRSTYFALLAAMRELKLDPAETVVAGDIGCTILGMNEPFRVCWTEVAMGNSPALAGGMALAGVRKPVVAAMGDGTFFHAGLPPLVDAVASGGDLPLLVLDNDGMSMTGFQETAGRRVPIERVARGAGARQVWVRNPYRVRSAVRAMKRLLTEPGVNVLVMRAPCVARSPLPPRVPMLPQVEVDQRRCPGLGECPRDCISGLACPALVREGDRVRVAEEYCQSCGLCAHHCPRGAIRRRWFGGRAR